MTSTLINRYSVNRVDKLKPTNYFFNILLSVTKLHLKTFYFQKYNNSIILLFIIDSVNCVVAVSTIFISSRKLVLGNYNDL